MSRTVGPRNRVSSLVFSSLKFHQAKVLSAMQALGKVMGLGKAVGKPHPEPHRGGGEVVHRAHWWRKRSQTRWVQFVLQHHVVLLLQAPSLFCSAVLKPDFHLHIWWSAKADLMVSKSRFDGQQRHIWYVSKSLKRNLFSHLSLWEADSVSELSFSPDGDVPAVVELLLQLQPLVVGVHHPVLVLCSRTSWNGIL